MTTVPLDVTLSAAPVKTRVWEITIGYDLNLPSVGRVKVFWHSDSETEEHGNMSCKSNI